MSSVSSVATNQSTILACGLTKSYGAGVARTRVLFGVDFELRKGEVVYLAGPSGSGKSTLLSILGCILSPDEGRITLLGHDATGWDERQRTDFRRRNVGFIFQRFQLFRGLRAWENITVKLNLLGTPAAEAKEIAMQLLESLGLGNRADRHINQLSVGQLQRIAVARALAGDPALILADEPTASLDVRSGKATVRMLEHLAELGKAVLVVTHDERILRRARRVVRMEDGRVVG